jgi:hypothetical protein
MAKRKKATRRRSRSLSAGSTTLSKGRRRKGTRRRRRMSAGPVDKLLNMVRDPLIGGIAGAAVGAAIRVGINKLMKDNPNEALATGAPVLLGFMVRKKAPAFAAGLIAVPALNMLQKQFPMLAENNSTYYTDSDLLTMPLPYGAPLNEATFRNSQAPFLSQSAYMMDVNDNGNDNW